MRLSLDGPFGSLLPGELRRAPCGKTICCVRRVSRASAGRFSEHGFLHQRGAVHLSESAWPELPPDVTAYRVDRPELDAIVPGLKPHWIKALIQPGCADIDVAGLHAAFIRQFKRRGGKVATNSALVSAVHRADFVGDRTRQWIEAQGADHRRRGRRLGGSGRGELRGRAAGDRTETQDHGPASCQANGPEGVAAGQRRGRPVLFQR